MYCFNYFVCVSGLKSYEGLGEKAFNKGGKVRLSDVYFTELVDKLLIHS